MKPIRLNRSANSFFGLIGAPIYGELFRQKLNLQQGISPVEASGREPSLLPVHFLFRAGSKEVGRFSKRYYFKNRINIIALNVMKCQ